MLAVCSQVGVRRPGQALCLGNRYISACLIPSIPISSVSRIPTALICGHFSVQEAQLMTMHACVTWTACPKRPSRVFKRFSYEQPVFRLTTSNASPAGNLGRYITRWASVSNSLSR